MERHILDPIDWRVSIPMMGASFLALSQVTHPTGLRAEGGDSLIDTGKEEHIFTVETDVPA